MVQVFYFTEIKVTACNLCFSKIDRCESRRRTLFPNRSIKSEPSAVKYCVPDIVAA